MSYLQTTTPSCSVCRRLRIVSGSLEDYRALSVYHYRDGRLSGYAAIFALKSEKPLSTAEGITTAGVIVYTMPSANLELRNIATGGAFTGFDRATQLSLINKNIRCISRVIIDPRLRSLGLAARLVRETMGLMNVPIIEALAVMGMVNPFFEKAGMKAYAAKMPQRCVQLTEALSIAGIQERELIDPLCVQRKLDTLPAGKARLIEQQIKKFLQCYGKRRNMSEGIERTRYILTKLTERPVYYIWFNPNDERNSIYRNRETY